jgi:hypothetical protein
MPIQFFDIVFILFDKDFGQQIQFPYFPFSICRLSHLYYFYILLIEDTSITRLICVRYLTNYSPQFLRWFHNKLIESSSIINGLILPTQRSHLHDLLAISFWWSPRLELSESVLGVDCRTSTTRILQVVLKQSVRHYFRFLMHALAPSTLNLFWTSWPNYCLFRFSRREDEKLFLSIPNASLCLQLALTSKMLSLLMMQCSH